MARKKKSKSRTGKKTGKATTRKPAARRETATRGKGKRTRATARPRRRTARRRRRDLQGPPPREATLMRGDREREADERLSEQTATSPRLSGGDVDADWQRAASVGEEAVGGSVATPDQDVVDELGAALGVPRAPDEPVRSSEEILQARDRRRQTQED